MPAQRAQNFSRGFTLLELLVVVSILVVATLVFMSAFLGSAGTPLDIAVLKIGTMTGNIRQNAAIRKTHGELVLDYANDRVISLSRERMVTFAFENMVGSNKVLSSPTGNAFIQHSSTKNLLDGGALELPDNQSGFKVPWTPRFEVKGDYEGVAVRFDFYPFGSGTPGTTPPIGQIANLGSVFVLEAVDLQPRAVRIGLTCGGVLVQDMGWVATDRWCTVEVAVSRYGVSLYVDGRTNVGSVDADFEVPSSNDADFSFSGFEGRVDNLDIYSMVSSEVVEFTGSKLLYAGVDPMLEATDDAEDIYIQPNAGSNVTGSSGSGYKQQKGLPAQQVSPIRHIYFDSAGQLDRARHAGSEYIYLISFDDGNLQRVTITVHPLGAVTSDYHDKFPWEADEDNPDGGGK